MKHLFHKIDNIRWRAFFRERRFKLFLLGVTLLKLLLMGLFSSDYEIKMFQPFVRLFFDHIGENPYELFSLLYGYEAFPYPPLMLGIESIGLAMSLLASEHWFLSHLLFKLPLLFFDYMGLWYLMRLYPRRQKYIGILYFASPIILYSTYMHGQLDVIPTTLFLGAIYYLLQKGRFSTIKFAVMVTLALLTKFHILAAVPLLFIFLEKKQAFSEAAFIFSSVLALGLVAILPFSGNAFWRSVLFNQEQSLLTQVYLSFVHLQLYLPILALAVIYFQAFMLRNINKDLLISFCGLLFAVFLALVPPMPGWYVWIVPYITTFFIHVDSNKYKNLIICGWVHFFYLLYFGTAHQTPWVDLYLMNAQGGEPLAWLKIDQAIYRNVVFTLLTGSLLYVIYALYHYGIASNLFYKRMGSPFAIGIAGDSGSGKSTLLTTLRHCFGERHILFIEGDGDHKWVRGAEMWRFYTHLNPKANYLYRQAKDIASLKEGNTISRVEYDHHTGTFTAERQIKPKQYILLSGLHAFYLPQMRQVLDLKIFMDTDENLRRYWKIQRDIESRGYSQEKILTQLEQRVPDTEKYITPQKAYADLVIRYFEENLTDGLTVFHPIALSLKFTLSSSINMEPMLTTMNEYGLQPEHEFSSNLNRQVILFRGQELDNGKIDFGIVMPRVIPHLEELSQEDFSRIDNREGVVAMMILLVISYKMQFDA